MKRVAIIGAGIAGLAAGIRLRQKGYEVDIYEKEESPGGKIKELHKKGFRFDKGPSLFTMPHLLEEVLLGEPDPVELMYEKLELVTRYFYEDGTMLNGWSDPERFAREIEEQTKEPREAVLQYLNYCARIYELTHSTFLEKSLHQLRTYLNSAFLKGMMRFTQIDVSRTMNTALEEYFNDARVLQLFQRYATYNGSSPFVAPATLNVIAHLEHGMGAYFPEEGMYGIIKALVKKAELTGVCIHYSSPVGSILLQGKSVTGVKVNGHERAYDAVVSNSDVHHTYQYLLNDRKGAAKVARQEKSSSALIFYWGMDMVYPKLDLHNIFFTANYREEFRHLFHENLPYEDPTVYVYISSKKRSHDAPAGSENWFVMINVPNNQGQDWAVLKEQARQSIVQKLQRILGCDIESHIIFEEVLDPVQLEQETAAYRGALYGNSSNSRFAAFLRPSNFSRKYKNLFFCGGTVHPGGGIPLCLLSGKIVASMFKTLNESE